LTIREGIGQVILTPKFKFLMEDRFRFAELSKNRHKIELVTRMGFRHVRFKSRENLHF